MITDPTTSQQAQHSKTPWTKRFEEGIWRIESEADERIVADVYKVRDADLILGSCNRISALEASHRELREALQAFREAVGPLSPRVKMSHEQTIACDRAMTLSRAALARAAEVEGAK